MKKKHHLIQGDRVEEQVRRMLPPRVPARMEGSVKNAGIRQVRKAPKPRAK